MSVIFNFKKNSKAKKNSRQKAHVLWIALLCVILLHLIFFLGVAPYLRFKVSVPQPTEVVQISPQELSQMKNQMKDLAPLLQQELSEKFKADKAPDDAKYMGAFNQKVPEQMVAGPQRDAPQLERKAGEKVPNQQQAQQEQRDKQQNKLSLKELGLGSDLKLNSKYYAKNLKRQGDYGRSEKDYRAVGRDDPNLKKGEYNLLNAAENQYYSFFVRFEEPIIRNWFFLMSSNQKQIASEIANRKIKAGSELHISVEFVIDRQGNFQEIRLVDRSGVPTLDSATRQSVAKLGSLPNPPQGLFKGEKYFSYRLGFMVFLNDSPVATNPGLRWY